MFPLLSPGQNVDLLEQLREDSEEVPLVPPEHEEPILDICSPCSSCSIASSIVVHISEEERQKYEEEIRKLYKQLDDKVTYRCHTGTFERAVLIGGLMICTSPIYIIHYNEFTMTTS